MSLDKVQKEAYFQEVRKAYDAFVDRKKGIRDSVLSRLREEAEAESLSMTADFAEYLHTLHDKGVSWATLAKACRKYGNMGEFDKIRKAFTPESETDLRSEVAKERKAVEETTPHSWGWVDDTTLEVVIGDDRFQVTSVLWQEGEDDEPGWPEFEMPDQYLAEHYTRVLTMVEDALDERGKA